MRFFEAPVLLLCLLTAAAVVSCAAEDAADVPGASQQGDSSRLEQVRDRGSVVCATNVVTPGFSYLDDGGNNAGFDIDLCRAVAAAVLGDPSAVEFRIVAPAERGPVLQSGEIDILASNTTWTSSRDSQWGNFAQVMFYGGQGFMVRRGVGIDSAFELQDASVCVTQGTTTELNLQDFSTEFDLNIAAVTFEHTNAALDAYSKGQCDALTVDRFALSAFRDRFPDRDNHVILPETISEEPLGPVVPHGDEQWYDVVKTVMAILVYAEANDVGRDEVPTSETGKARVDRLFGLSGSYGQEEMGLSMTVAQDVIRAVGNYGEIYDRHFGPDGVNLPRENSRNALWADAPCRHCPKGGQIYAAPLR